MVVCWRKREGTKKKDDEMVPINKQSIDVPKWPKREKFYLKSSKKIVLLKNENEI